MIDYFILVFQTIKAKAEYLELKNRIDIEVMGAEDIRSFGMQLITSDELNKQASILQSKVNDLTLQIKKIDEHNLKWRNEKESITLILKQVILPLTQGWKNKVA